VKAQASRDIHVLSKTGVARVSTGANAVTLQPSQLLIAREKRAIDITRQSNGAVRLTLPYKISGVDDAGNALAYKLIVDIDRGGMTFVPRTKLFEGRLYVGVIDSRDPSARQSLPQPISIQVTGQVDQIEPAILQVVNTNLPFQPVRLVAAMIGLLAAAAYTVGVNLTAIRPTATVGQALVFVVAGVGAYAGTLFIPK